VHAEGDHLAEDWPNDPNHEKQINRGGYEEINRRQTKRRARMTRSDYGQKDAQQYPQNDVVYPGDSKGETPNAVS
jgi:hypothetical protein